MNTTTSHSPESSTQNQVGVIGVRTTRIYCRPDCRPGRSSLPQNRVVFENSASAREAGFRPCKKCKPDAGPMETLRFGRAMTEIGGLFGVLSDRGLCALYLCDRSDPTPVERLKRDFPGAELVEDHEAVRTVLERAVAHILHDDPIDGIELDLRGTEFQRKVWQALLAIPRGKTTTYGELTRSLGMESGAARAVGSACGANPVSLLVPCHRVLRSGGGLGGYYWGLLRKQALLELENPAFHAEPRLVGAG